MRSPYCSWLTKLQTVADKENIVVEAQHHDCLEYLFQTKVDIEEAFIRYKNFLTRYNALNEYAERTRRRNAHISKVSDVYEAAKAKVSVAQFPQSQSELQTACIGLTSLVQQLRDLACTQYDPVVWDDVHRANNNPLYINNQSA